jgi:hypothetical protein
MAQWVVSQKRISGVAFNHRFGKIDPQEMTDKAIGR